MAGWRAAAIERAADISLAEWSVLEVALDLESETCTWHFIGVTTGPRHNAQVSSPVLMFDRKTGRGITESGRVYQLMPGRHGRHAGVLRTWERWKTINHIVVDKDVTAQVLHDMQRR